jgi:hypothetical protein
MTFAEPTGFELFWQTYVLTYGAPIAQILLWLVQITFFVVAIVLLTRAVGLLRRWVDFSTGMTAVEVEAAEVAAAVAAAAGEVPAAPAAAAAEKIKVDEFVE